MSRSTHGTHSLEKNGTSEHGTHETLQTPALIASLPHLIISLTTHSITHLVYMEPLIHKLLGQCLHRKKGHTIRPLEKAMPKRKKKEEET